MSLQVWLPLNGDLHNQGLSNITVTNNGATVDNNGKIGKCYSFNGSNSVIYNRNIFINCNKLSMCCWIYRTTSHTGDGYISSLNNGAGYADAAIALDSPSSTSVCFIGGGNYSLKATISPNTWNHIAVTYDGVKVIGYLNGQKVGEVANTQILTRTQLAIGCRCNSTDSFIYYFPGKLNDFRLYDHAISAKEVEEIAKGLVLHYKLDDRFCEPTTNLCNNLKSGGRTVLSTNPLMITTTGENADTYWYVQTSSTLVGGNTYTLSLQCSGLAPGEYFQFGIGAQSGANNCGHFPIYNGYNEKTFTLASGLDGVKQFILDDSSYSTGVRSKQISFYNVQLEAKDHATGYAGVGGSRVATTIYDSSGYGNNGTIVGSLEMVSDSSRYSCATKFNGSSAIKVNDNNWMAQGASDLTVNIWTYMDNWSNWNGHRLYSCTEGGGFNIENTIANSLTFPVCVYTNTAHSTTGYIPTESRVAILKTDLAPGWHMFTYIYTETECQCYLDGILYQTKPYVSYGVYFNINGSRLFLGCEANGVNASGPYFTGQESDFRLYYTALTPEQIKELYNTSMSIDDKGNIHARELVEL